MKKIIIILSFILIHFSLPAQVKCNGGLFLKMTHKATVARGGGVRMDFMLTNRTGADIDISFIKNTSTIVDNFGRRYSGDNIEFDFANTGLSSGMIPGGASVKFRCTLRGIDEDATAIPLMMLKYKCSLSEDGSEWILFVRKVKLTE